MIKNIIFGKRSNLTSSILKKLGNCEVIPSSKINLFKDNYNEKIKKNYIINNFYPSFKLNELNPNQYENFIKDCVLNLVKILNNINLRNVNKIIYTSSSSVYSLEENLKNINDDKFNRKIYASFKHSAERILENFCKQKKINFYIMRIFNTYGDSNDKFSFIEKLIKIKKLKSKLNLLNNGISLRDFIHIDDVANIYKKFLYNNYDSGIYDIGTGEAKLIKHIVDFINIDKRNIVKLNNVAETTKSVANTKKLQTQLGKYKFKSLETYLKHKLFIKNKKNIFSIKLDHTKGMYEGSAIYGAGFAGKKLYTELKEQKEKIIFFIDDDIKKQNKLLFGIPVISYVDLKKVNNRKFIDKVFIAIPSLSKNKIQKLNDRLSKSFFDIRYLPEKKFLFNNKINLNDIKIDQINLFLNRKPIIIKKIKNLKKKKILVTGAAGTIGFEICRQLLYQDAGLIIGIDHSEIAIYQKQNQINKKMRLLLCDVNNHIFLDQIIKKNKIDLIIHAAAYKHVNILEKNINVAVRNNIIGTKKICELANNNNVNLILISTDKAAEPKSVLGYSKKICERIINYYSHFNKNNFFNIVRFGNVFGSSGSAVIKFIEQINNNESLTITNKSATRFFMTILEACYLVLETTSFKIKNKTFILNMGKPVNIYQLAKKLGEYKKKLDPNYEIKFIKTGLKKNEKLHEKLFEKKEKLKKINKKIFYVSNHNFDHEKFYKLFSYFEKNYNYFPKKKIVNCLKLICNT